MALAVPSNRPRSSKCTSCCEWSARIQFGPLKRFTTTSAVIIGRTKITLRARRERRYWLQFFEDHSRSRNVSVRRETAIRSAADYKFDTASEVREKNDQEEFGIVIK